MNRCIVSRTIRTAAVFFLSALIAMGASCMEEAATIPHEPLHSCVVFPDGEASEAKLELRFNASHLDYAHLLESATEQDILDHRRKRLGSPDGLKQHYRRTFVRELPDMVKEAFAPDWDTWTEWRTFHEAWRQGDELWYFLLPVSGTNSRAPRRGYVIIRDGKLHAMLLNRTVVFHASYADYEPLLCGVATEDQIVGWKQQPFASIEELCRHFREHFGPDSSRIVLEDRCTLDEAGEGGSKWDRWHVFARQFGQGDRLWYFESPAETWSGPFGRCGYLITRHGRLHAILVVAIS